ncbi:ABC transporter substrate-binding protein [Denitrobaculum tricleocarpae]|uniref:Extracellular solute-binding protein n=1 Tax=Denitrobaculum tricleocarpae TaxID=2591009 RepID=A0A545TMF0_9PROT|nr:extracellular solute-binding protein [Denitrobaculum tricleocarpae]TQV78402.1 extracellular solute-binding protein [Denitrobaculum tricleocarpae]
MSVRFTRRGLLKTGAGVTAALAMPAIVSAAGHKKFEGKTVRLLTWSDNTGLAILNHIAKPFEEATGAKVIADRTGSTSEMVAKLRASGGRAQYDVITLAGVGAVELAKDGLLAKPDLNQLPNLQDVDPRFRTGADGHGIGYLLWTGGLVYNTKTFKSPPTSYAELWEEQYADRLFLPPATWTDALDTIFATSRMLGGDGRDADAALAKLGELRNRLLTFGENPTQLVELFRSDALDIGGVYAPAFFAKELADPANSNMGATYDVEEGFFADLMYTIMPKAKPGEDDVVHAFMNYTLDAKVQGVMAEAVLNGPINQKAEMSAAAKASPFIIKPEQLGDKAIVHDKEFIAEVREDWIKRYTQTLA